MVACSTIENSRLGQAPGLRGSRLPPSPLPGLPAGLWGTCYSLQSSVGLSVESVLALDALILLQETRVPLARPLPSNILWIVLGRCQGPQRLPETVPPKREQPQYLSSQACA